jgi:hypothetical protein
LYVIIQNDGSAFVLFVLKGIHQWQNAKFAVNQQLLAITAAILSVPQPENSAPTFKKQPFPCTDGW